MIIPNHNYTPREATVANILKTLDIKSFINVGFHDWQDPRRHWWIKICDINNIDWKIIEVFEHNVQDAIQKGCDENKIILENIANVDDLPESDCLMFWHGPEHLDKTIFLEILPKLEKKYKILIFGMPLGEEPQGVCYGNPFEEHISSWTTNEWKEMGYEVMEVFDSQPYPHITTYKINK
jgi:hypothetical protein